MLNLRSMGYNNQLANRDGISNPVDEHNHMGNLAVERIYDDQVAAVNVGARVGSRAEEIPLYVMPVHVRTDEECGYKLDSKLPSLTPAIPTDW